MRQSHLPHASNPGMFHRLNTHFDYGDEENVDSSPVSLKKEPEQARACSGRPLLSPGVDKPLNSSALQHRGQGQQSE